MISLKTLCPGGIRTRVFWSWGGCEVHCSKPTLISFLIFQINFFH
jgi:hypothetical protein